MQVEKAKKTKKQITHIEFIREELQKKQDINKHFSLRSFAVYLGVNPGWLSSILNQKTDLSLNMAEKIFDKLCESDSQKSLLLESVVKRQKERTMKRRDPRVKTFSLDHTELVKMDHYERFSRWYYFAILELLEVDHFVNDNKWIANELGLTTFQVDQALADMIEEGLVTKVGNNLKKTYKHFASEDKAKTSLNLRKAQKEIREKSIESIDNVEIERRSHTHIVMAIDPALLSEAKLKIQKFQRELCDFLEQSKREKVYLMEIGLFPIEK